MSENSDQNWLIGGRKKSAGECVKNVAHPPKVCGVDAIGEVASIPHAFGAWENFLVHFYADFPPRVGPNFQTKIGLAGGIYRACLKTQTKIGL